MLAAFRFVWTLRLMTEVQRPEASAGTSTVEGEQALAFLRRRHGFSDGSDIGRVQAQQGFMASLRKVKSEGTLSNPGRLAKYRRGDYPERDRWMKRRTKNGEDKGFNACHGRYA